MRFVVDSSVTLAWCLKDERNAYARKVEDAVIEGSAFAPALWPYEVANALAMAERRGRLAVAEREEILEAIAALGISVEAGPQAVPNELISLAQRWKLTAYDAAYLHLAQSQNVPIATIDAKLVRAAKVIRVDVLFG